MANLRVYNNRICTNRWLLMFFIAIHCIINAVIQCNAITATLGIDWGEEFVKVSIAFRGYKPDILLNFSGSRKFHNAVYFLEETRLFDRDALSFAVKNPSKTLQRSAHMLGVPFPKHTSLWYKTTSITAKEVTGIFNQHNLPFNWEYTPYEFCTSTDGQLHLNVVKNSSISIEEAQAHFFNYVKHVAVDKLVKSKIVQSPHSDIDISAVISIPCNYTQSQRRAIVYAAECAGIKVLDLVHGITAAAWLGSLEMEPGTKRVLFYDLGSSGANIGVIEIQIPDSKAKKSAKPCIKTLSCVTAPGIGGRQHDILLAEYLRDAFEKKHDVKLMPEHPGALQKLLNSANKAKNTLTFAQHASVEIERLIKNANFDKQVVTKETFEGLLKPVVDKLNEPITKALELAGVKIEELDSVEVIGGAWRVPIIQKKLSELMAPLPLGFHLNAEEAIAMGAGYLAAAHNPFFRMKKIAVSDISVYTYSLHIVTNNQKSPDYIDKRVVLYDKNSKINTLKSLDLKCSFDFEFTLYEDDLPLSTHKVSGLESLLRNEGNSNKIAKVNLVFNSNVCGIIKFERCYATLIDKVKEEIKNEPAPPSETEDNKAKEEVKGEVKNEEPAPPSEPEDNTVKEDVKGEEKDEPSKQSEGKKEEPTPSKDSVKKEVKKIERKAKPVEYALTFTSTENTIYTATKLQASKAALDAHAKSDRDIIERSESKNQLESLIYKYKNVLKSQSFKQAASEESYDQFSKRVLELLDWFENNSDKATMDEFNNSIKSLNDLALPIYKIMNDNEARPELIKSTDASLENLREKLNALIQEKPYLTEHVSTINLFNSNLEWWDNIKKEQEARELYLKPLFDAELVKTKLDIAKYAINTLEKINPPEEKEEEPMTEGEKEEVTDKEVEPETHNEL